MLEVRRLIFGIKQGRAFPVDGVGHFGKENGVAGKFDGVVDFTGEICTGIVDKREPVVDKMGRSAPLVNIARALEPKVGNRERKNILRKHRNAKGSAFLDALVGIVLFHRAEDDGRGVAAGLNKGIDNAPAKPFGGGGGYDVKTV